MYDVDDKIDDLLGSRRGGRFQAYEKYRKSNLFEDCKDNIAPITDKVTNRVYINKFEPKYRERGAREIYQDSVLTKDKRAKTLKVLNREKTEDNLFRIRRIPRDRNFNAMDIKIRNDYRGYNVNEYKLKRTKSVFIPRSNINNEEKNTMDSRIRKIYAMTSDIFNINEKPKFTVQDLNRSFHATKVKKIEEEKEAKEKRNALRRSMTHSRISTNQDWKNSNTEPMKKKMKEFEDNYNKNLRDGNFNRKYFLTKRDFNSEISLLDKKTLNVKTNPTNVESVNYNILSTEPSLYRNTISSFSNKKPIECMYDDYEINCDNNNYNQVNSKKLINLLHKEGIHVYNFKEEGNEICGNNGKFIFQIRKGNRDEDFADKLKKINNKLKQKDMTLQKVKVDKSKKS